jgi:hypothetical protein
MRQTARPWGTCSAPTIVMLLEATTVVRSPSTFKTDTPNFDMSLLGGG